MLHYCSSGKERRESRKIARAIRPGVTTIVSYNFSRKKKKTTRGELSAAESKRRQFVVTRGVSNMTVSLLGIEKKNSFYFDEEGERVSVGLNPQS